MSDRISSPPKWTAIDSEVEAQAERTRDLHRRSHEASDAARRASEAVAAIERDDQARRASALAEGAKSDPGRDAETIAIAEREAQEAAEAAAVLADAYAQARARLDTVCDERSQPWAREARKRLERAAVELRAAVEVVEAAYTGWRDATAQVSLATGERSRRKSFAADVELAGLRSPNGAAYRASEAIAALAAVTDPQPVEVTPEPEPLSEAERREIRATGGVVLPAC